MADGFFRLAAPCVTSLLAACISTSNANAPHALAAKPFAPGCSLLAGGLARGTAGQPVVLWAGAMDGPGAQAARHWAGQGYAVIAATGASNAAAPLFRCLDAVAASSRLMSGQVGLAGEGASAAQALAMAADSRVRAVILIDPVASGALPRPNPNAPVLIVSTGAGAGAKAVFDQTAVATVWASAASDVDAADAARATQEATDRWFSWLLRWDYRAADTFIGPACGMCGDVRWRVVRTPGWEIRRALQEAS